MGSYNYRKNKKNTLGTIFYLFFAEPIVMKLKLGYIYKTKNKILHCSRHEVDFNQKIGFTGEKKVLWKEIINPRQVEVDFSIHKYICIDPETKEEYLFDSFGKNLSVLHDDILSEEGVFDNSLAEQFNLKRAKIFIIILFIVLLAYCFSLIF